jgi:hypothetical protein
VGAREYLESTSILKVLHDGMCAAAKVRPKDPRQFLADYLLDHAPVPAYVQAMEGFGTEEQLAKMDALHKGEIARLAALFDTRAGQGRATTQVGDAARAATFGAIDTLMVDIDDVVPGLVDETTGAVTLHDQLDATNYGVIDEIAGRVLANGGRVLGLRRADIPQGGTLAAILRYPI